jgi:penicillin G amidase
VSLVVIGLAWGAACRTPPAAAPPLQAQVSGTLEVAGVTAPVRIVRDRWGVPHIYARSRDDLFFAQGFVQAEDRLFQMDLWRRSVQGRLSEVLGSNFIERDATTRRMQYRGALDVEWASYGPDAEAIATAFVHGVNAWVAIARKRLPEEFVLAGWTPESWSPGDLLNRTDAFAASGDAIEEIRRAHLSDVIADAIRRVGAPPFFVSLAAPVRAEPHATSARGERSPGNADRRTGRDGHRAEVGAGHADVSRGRPLTFSDPYRAFDNPASRYFVHLHAPEWNVIGATRPWLPGVAIGHNERAAWAMTAFDADTQDVYAEPLQASHRVIVKDAVVVKGRAKPFEFDSELTPHAVIIASDRERRLAYAIRWSGTEPGAAAELGALALDRARTWADFRAALMRWKLPARRFVYADAGGGIGEQAAGLIPVRRAGEWRGWMTLDDLPHAFNPASGAIVVGEPPAATPADGAVEFAHPLGVTSAARLRFTIGPVARPSGDASPIRGSFDPADWDRSRALVAPGQSGSPSSPHFADLVGLWERGEAFPLAFSDEAVAADALTSLTLEPRRPR